MAITHYPDPATLMTCSAGSTPEALCAVVASHLALCPKSMEELGKLESIGIALFNELQPVAMKSNAKSVEPMRCEPVASTALPMLKAVASSKEPVSGDIPAPLVDLLGPNLADLAWEPLSAGMRHFNIQLSAAAAGDLRLVELSPGRTIPEHGSKGEQYTVVLTGGCTELANGNERDLRKGDFVELEDDDRHAFTAGDAGCTLLIGGEGPPNYVSLLRQAA